ncbi:MAG: NAD-dependent epimerase/dehydratase family protein [Armatimonadia bacterium]|nr:NAD-dependent epimerase/dehydratase family protein [Armatimonadia bacterium]
MRVFITGGAGFLGMHVANYLADRGHESVVYDLEPMIPEDFPEGTKGIVGDIRDHVALDAAIADTQPDVIMHGAAALPLWKPEDIFTINVDGTRIVLRLARKHGIDRVVFISSTAVYGVPEKHPLEETDPMVGVGPYGESKIEAELACEKGRAEGLCVPIIRPKTFIGTGRLGVFQILCDWVESGTRIPLIGSGDNTYQLLDVEDLAESIYLCLTGPADQVDGTFNVGSHDLRPVKEYVGELCEYAGTGSRPMGTPAWLVIPLLRLLEALHLSPLYKWVYGTAHTDSWVSTEKIERELGWEPKYSNGDALIRCYQWYLDHKDELAGATGVTHRVAWHQGALGFIKKILTPRKK